MAEIFDLKIIDASRYDALKDQVKVLESEILEAMTMLKSMQNGEKLSRFYSQTPLIQQIYELYTHYSVLADQEDSQRWIREGLQLFSTALNVKGKSLTYICDTVIAQLVKYLKACQGAIYIIDEQANGNHVLKMTGCYAMDRKKFLNKTVQPGEGLVGQVYLEKDIIHLTKIPKDYIRIMSGLGEAYPTALLIVPLMLNEEVYGIVELLSFKKFSKTEIAFIQQLAASIATIIFSIQLSEHNNRLLTDLVHQTDVLQQKEADLKETLEKAKETQKASVKTQKQYKEVINAIEQSAIICEFSPQGVIQRVNQNFKKAMGYTEEEVVGKHHQMLVTPETANSFEYKLFWKKLQAGEFIVGDFERISKSNKQLWLRGSFMPIRNEVGQIEKVYKISFDITLERMQQQRIVEQQKIIQSNEKLLMARTKSIQDQAYKRIKDLQEQLAEKDKLIEQLLKNQQTK